MINKTKEPSKSPENHRDYDGTSTQNNREEAMTSRALNRNSNQKIHRRVARGTLQKGADGRSAVLKADVMTLDGIGSTDVRWGLAVWLAGWTRRGEDLRHILRDFRACGSRMIEHRSEGMRSRGRRAGFLIEVL